MNIVVCGRFISRVGAEAGVLKRRLFLSLLDQNFPPFLALSLLLSQFLVYSLLVIPKPARIFRKK